MEMTLCCWRRSRNHLPLGIAQLPLLCGFGKHWNPLVTADSPTSGGSTYAPVRSWGSGESAFPLTSSPSCLMLREMRLFGVAEAWGPGWSLLYRGKE